MENRNLFFTIALILGMALFGTYNYKAKPHQSKAMELKLDWRQGSWPQIQMPPMINSPTIPGDEVEPQSPPVEPSPPTRPIPPSNPPRRSPPG